MHQEYAEKWQQFCEHLSKPIGELVDLNLRTINRWAKASNPFDEFVHAKKPEEFLSAQMRLASTAGLEAMRYGQEANAILLEAASNASKVFTDAFRETTDKASQMVKSSKLKEYKE